MRNAAALTGVLGLALLAGCAGPGPQAGFAPERRNAATCLDTFRRYEDAVRSFGYAEFGDRTRPNATVARYGQDLITQGCITRAQDIAGIEQVAQQLQPLAITDSGAPTRPTAVQAGIVDGFSTQARVSAYFAALGINSRSIGAPAVGRRILIGPFHSEGAIAQAIDAARLGGFISPYATRTRY